MINSVGIHVTTIRHMACCGGVTLVTVEGFWETAATSYRNKEMVIKRGVSVFWRWLCKEILLYFERRLETFDRFCPQNALKKTD